MLPLKSVVFPRTNSEHLESSGGMNRWKKLYKKGNMTEAQGTKTAHIDGAQQSMLSGWESQRHRKRNSPQYSLIVLVFSVLPNRWTTQTRMYLVSVVYAMMLVSLCPLTKKKWRHGLSTVVGCSVSSLSGQATSPLNSPNSSPQESCAVYSRSVSNNSIGCSECKPWVHKKCSGITNWLVGDPN